MYEYTVDQDGDPPLSHDSPCVRCGHAAHVHLPCGGECECQPTAMPGERERTRRR